MPFLFQYLGIHEIAKLDTSICNHEERKDWLNCLASSINVIDIEDHEANILNCLNNFVDWIVLKNLLLDEFNIILSEENSSRQTITIPNEAIMKLTQNNPNLRILTFLGTRHCIMDEKCIQHIANCCHNLEEFWLEHDDGSIIWKPLIQIIKNNKNLKEIKLRNVDISGEILTVFADFCPQLESVTIFTGKGKEYSTKPLKLTNKQIERFTSKCRNLKFISILDRQIIMKHSKLFECLGKYNPLLQSVTMYLCRDTQDAILSLPSESFKSLLQGCPLLQIFLFMSWTISNEDVANLIKYGTNISEIFFNGNKIVDNELIEIGKMLNLELIELNNIVTITDEGMKSLITNHGYKFKEITITYCPKLTDISVLSIATHCSNLETICLRELSLHSSDCFMELFHKCPKLIEISTDSEFFPKELINLLKTRAENLN